MASTQRRRRVVGWWRG